MLPEAFVTTRIFATSADQVYQAYTDPSLLQQRRGPTGFTNEFEVCNPVTDGDWRFTMIGPNGARHPNESKFRLVSPERIIIEHVVKPHYVLTISIEAIDQGTTRMTRHHQFDTVEIYDQIKGFVPTANEQNFDRLETLLTNH